MTLKKPTPDLDPRWAVPLRGATQGTTAQELRRLEVWLIGRRNAGLLIVVEAQPVFGAGDFRPFTAVTQIDHRRSPARRERAFVLDREIDLQILVLVVAGEIGRAHV